MFSGYNLKLDRSFFYDKELSFEEYEQMGNEHLENEKQNYKKDLMEYITQNTINGSKLQDDWFPTIEADIFISHSRMDQDLANALAGWIYYTFEISVFIDSNVWSYSADLLEEINSKYSNKRRNATGGYLYNHESCNQASQHVNIMLSVALQNMIDNVECVMLLNTDNSISVFDKEKEKINTTYSPWIYTEIICTKIVRKKPLIMYRDYPISCNESATFDKSFMYFSKLMISYNVSLNHLKDISDNELNEWANEFYKYYEDINYNRDYMDYPLDALYNFTHRIELNNTYLVYNKNSQSQIKNFKFALGGNEDIYQNMNNKYLIESNSDFNCEICDGYRFCLICCREG
ncbi:hypothetical protein QA584_17500 [Anaerocolumna sp. AGMB13025]|uniref:hypothetical protein n=1 Tax=Anaerocolumna sp. AGMB13025 TaxID=3039116 RepID=UPI00241E7BCE|nr:hypothetical protein [Anaerocolumna sp. AGMB13025]WFR55397.1 hypothetical protein QA584_17500 [Anaerocolumna sp. AGMB13025]